MAGKRKSEAEKAADAAARIADRVVELRDKGRRIAEYMRANPGCFQEQAALLGAGVSRARYYELLAMNGEAEQAFQAEVMPAVYEMARAAEEKAESDIACTEGGSSAWSSWHRWKLAQRHRKIFGDLAQKVELSGPDGGPIETAVRYVVTLPQEEPDDDED